MSNETILPLKPESREQIFLILGWTFVVGFCLWLLLRFAAVFFEWPGIPRPNHFLILEILILLFILWVFLRDIYSQLARIYADQNHLEKALSYYAWARRLNPWHLPTLTAIANVWGDLGDWEKAAPLYEQVLAKEADNLDALNGLAHVYLMRQDGKQAYEHFKQAYLYKRGVAHNQVGDDGRKAQLSKFQKNEGLRLPVYKLQHDLEQFDYLSSQGLVQQHFEDLKSDYQWVLDQILANPQNQNSFEVQNRLRGKFGHNLYFEAPGAVAHKEILGSCDATSIEKNYLKSQPHYVFYDGFLRPDILKALQNFCLRATIWHDDSREAGYLGSNLDDGFNCPLLYQIAEALRQQFPQIFSDLPLIYMWAFKCDSERKGVALHTDSAEINVNFWITPDSANLDPEHGGISIYTAEPPMEWDFQENTSEQKVLEKFLKKSKSKKISIPYRENRVVIFDSRLIHETDDFKFKTGYTNRRINITLLFGKKALKIHKKPKIDWND